MTTWIAAHQTSSPSPSPATCLNSCPLSWWCHHHLILCHSLLFLPSVFPSIRIFSRELALCIRCPKFWSFSISPSNEYLGLISFRIDWFDLLVVQGLSTVFSSTTVWRHQLWGTQPFFIVQLSHLYPTNGKTISLTIETFVGKVMSLLFNMLSRLVIAFLPRSKHLLISWLQSPSTVILESKKIKSVTVSIFSPSICYEVMGPDAMIFIFWMLSFMSTFSFSSFTFTKNIFSSSWPSATRVVSFTCLRLLIFLPAIFFSFYFFIEG